MRFLLLTIFTFTLTTTFAQITHPQTQTFLTQFSQINSNLGSPFIYYKGINQNVIKAICKQIELEEMFNNRKYESGKIQVSDTLILTNEERQYLLTELKKQSDTTLWNQLKIPNSIVIPQDTLTAISKDSSKGWNFFSKVYGKTLYNFSIPIFFRNNQYCLFYYHTTCGIKCGEEVFTIYKRKKNTWTKWISILETDALRVN